MSNNSIILLKSKVTINLITENNFSLHIFQTDLVLASFISNAENVPAFNVIAFDI